MNLVPKQIIVVVWLILSGLAFGQQVDSLVGEQVIVKGSVSLESAGKVIEPGKRLKIYRVLEDHQEKLLIELEGARG